MSSTVVSAAIKIFNKIKLGYRGADSETAPLS